MRLSRVYLDSTLALNTVISLPKEVAHYLSNVLRLRINDELLVFNSQQGEFRARVTSAAKRAVDIELFEKIRDAHDTAKQVPLSIHLVLGLSRGDRMDFAVQKSTELGVNEITPIYTEYGEVRLKADRVEKKLQHWQKIAISACEQSGRLDVPVIHKPLSVLELSLSENTNKWMLDPRGSDSLPQSIAENNCVLLVGPEGGFSADEIDWARSNDFQIVALGSRILRTETAPVAALAILQHKYGDM
ncbi:MAG: 16S rRNA (uracil(1498)-N(3))-methyltransferase [Proteobacteria bacterium]|jgi:16S rRNA (uracil1498-N3)-methyltransferase|nr:16S rRNA (uracil(1498)-N(3))-methyltransferase [Pseudomonadota bacterium]MDA1291092.1 16S rRNA (uracil(1498)-N(3))-methyltransferase [Pseudomonadota bacterium]